MIRASALAILLLAATGCGSGEASTGGGAVDAISVEPSTASVTPRAQQQFVAVVTATSVTTVTWTVQEGSPGGTITSAGLYTAPATTGAYHVVASSVADPSKTATAVVTVAAAPVVSVTVSPGSASVATGGTQQFTASVTGSSNTGVTWSVQEGVAGGSVSTSGLYTAPASAGTYHVVATSTGDGTKSGIAAVTVTGPPVITVTVSPGTVSLAPGATQQFTATVTNDANTAVTWSVLEGSPAAGTVTAGGLYTAPATVGSYHVVATSTADASRSGQGTVTVQQPGSAAYTRRAAMPAHDGTPTMNWLTGEIAIVRDSVGGDLVAFFRGSTSLRAAVSRDLGVTWSWVDPASTVNIGPPRTIHQDRNGRIHVGYGGPFNGAPAGVSYARIALARDGSGHVNGFAAEVTGVALPVSVNTSMDVRMQVIPGRDQAGSDTVFYAVFADGSSGSYGSVQAGKTTTAAGLSPTAGSHFVKLDGTAGTTQLFSGGSTGSNLDSSHNNGVEMAQHPVSGDLWFQWGPIETGDTNTQNRNPVRRLRATPSGPSTFAPGAVTVVDSFATYCPEIGSAVSTANHVWMARFSPASGYVVDRIDSAGNVTTSAIPSPWAVANQGGYVVLAVSSAGDRAWAGGWISYSSASNGSAFWASYWNGSTWQRFTDASLPDTWGVGRSMGWDEGLALVSLDPSTFAPSFATLRTSP